MEFKNVDLIHKHIKDQSQELEQDYIFESISNEIISTTEERIGFVFPKSYKIFLQKLGMPEFNDWTKFIPLEQMEICQNCGDMRWMVVFSKNVSDNIFLFWDSHEDEYDIFLWDPETWRCVKVADDFESWLNKQIDLITDAQEYNDHDFTLANNILEWLEKCKSCDLEGLKKYVKDI